MTQDEASRLAGAALGGAILGGSIAGPIGALIGALVGGAFGENANKEKRKRDPQYSHATLLDLLSRWVSPNDVISPDVQTEQ